MGDVTQPTFSFVKLSGSGNDFICINNLDGRFSELLSSPQRVARFAEVFCRRGTGIGADGLIFACPNEVGDHADIAARFLEPDGSETELCGNGVGCFAYWVVADGLLPDREIRILTSAGVVRATRRDAGYVRVCIPLPEQIQRDFSLEVAGTHWTCDFAVAGVPHLIVYVDGLDDLDVGRLGPAFRYHPRFAPRGANANFVEVLGEGEIAVRTYEFGVEAETLACGTGSAAAAILTAVRFGWPDEYTSGERPVRIRARSGDILRVYFTLDDDGVVTDLCLETAVRLIYRAEAGAGLVARALPGGDEP